MTQPTFTRPTVAPPSGSGAEHAVASPGQRAPGPRPRSEQILWVLLAVSLIPILLIVMIMIRALTLPSLGDPVRASASVPPANTHVRWQQIELSDTRFQVPASWTVSTDLSNDVVVIGDELAHERTIGGDGAARVTYYAGDQPSRSFLASELRTKMDQGLARTNANGIAMFTEYGCVSGRRYLEEPYRFEANGMIGMRFTWTCVGSRSEPLTGHWTVTYDLKGRTHRLILVAPDTYWGARPDLAKQISSSLTAR